MAINPLNTTIPQPQVPFLTVDGGVSREWVYYFLAILARTGGEAGISSAILQAQIGALATEGAMADVFFPSPSYALTASDVMAEVAQITNLDTAALLALSLDGSSNPAPLNPFLASLLVADAA